MEEIYDAVKYSMKNASSSEKTTLYKSLGNYLDKYTPIIDQCPRSIYRGKFETVVKSPVKRNTVLYTHRKELVTLLEFLDSLNIEYDVEYNIVPPALSFSEFHYSITNSEIPKCDINLYHKDNKYIAESVVEFSPNMNINMRGALEVGKHHIVTQTERYLREKMDMDDIRVIFDTDILTVVGIMTFANSYLNYIQLIRHNSYMLYKHTKEFIMDFGR